MKINCQKLGKNSSSCLIFQSWWNDIHTSTQHGWKLSLILWITCLKLETQTLGLGLDWHVSHDSPIFEACFLSDRLCPTLGSNPRQVLTLWTAVLKQQTRQQVEYLSHWLISMAPPPPKAPELFIYLSPVSPCGTGSCGNKNFSPMSNTPLIYAQRLSGYKPTGDFQEKMMKGNPFGFTSQRQNCLVLFK